MLTANPNTIRTYRCEKCGSTSDVTILNPKEGNDACPWESCDGKLSILVSEFKPTKASPSKTIFFEQEKKVLDEFLKLTEPNTPLVHAVKAMANVMSQRGLLDPMEINL